MDTDFDVIVIGGGITGAGIFYEAVSRGYKTLLLEKNDFASGTSSKSSKLVHGGLRYLEQFRFSLVKESLNERGKLVNEFPHLVKLAPFMFPVYKQKWKLKIGMMIYQWLSKSHDTPKYKFLSKSELIKKYPGINQTGLKGGFIYYDAITNDARLVNEVILNGVTIGGSAQNYTEVIKVENNNNCYDVHIKNQTSGTIEVIRTKYIINSTGAWSEDICKSVFGSNLTFSAPTKGVHILFKKNLIDISTTIYIPSFQSDGRYLFIIPWEDVLLFGTTDTNYNDDVDQCKLENDDIDYLLKTLNTFYPNINAKRENIVGSFSGLRPLFKGDGKPSKKSREYKIWWSQENILTIYGGKLTSFQSMAKNCLSFLPKKSKTLHRDSYPKNRFTEKYGPNSKLVYEIYSSDTKYTLQIIDNITIAEIIFFIRYTSVKTLDDLLTRRFVITYKKKVLQGFEEAVERISYLLKDELKWSENQRIEELERYLKQFSNSHLFTK